MLQAVAEMRVQRNRRKQPESLQQELQTTLALVEALWRTGDPRDHLKKYGGPQGVQASDRVGLALEAVVLRGEMVNQRSYKKWHMK